MLALVVATPSGWVLHDAAAAVMLGALYLYFATVFYRMRLSLFATHLSVPVLPPDAADHANGLVASQAWPSRVGVPLDLGVVAGRIFGRAPRRSIA